jgi:catechol 2,3-dioxygenase-like lactoylglutathione lyase family enzyme
MAGHGSDVDRTEEWEALRARYLQPLGGRPPSAARGLHHFAVVCSDVERTIRFWQELLECPLAELFENRDYRGSTHFFFDIGNSNYLAYFDFPGLDVGPYREVLGGLHHIAISVTPEAFDRLVAKVEAAGIEVLVVDGTSAYFPGPDGERIELLTYPLDDMYGTVVG